MPNLHEVGTRFVRRVVSVVAVLIAAGPTAAADDARPSEPPKVTTPPVVTYAEPPSGPPLLDNDLQAVPLLGPAYVAVETKYTALAGGGGLLVGGQAGWTFDPGLRFGFAGYGLAAATALAGADGQSTSMQLAYGGVRAAYVLRPRDFVHLTLATLVGLGSVGTVTSDPRSSPGGAGLAHPVRARARARGRDESFALGASRGDGLVSLPRQPGPSASRQWCRQWVGGWTCGRSRGAVMHSEHGNRPRKQQ